MFQTLENCFQKLSKDYLMFLSRKKTLSLNITHNVSYTNICMTLLVCSTFFRKCISKNIVYHVEKYRLSAQRLSIEQGRNNLTARSRLHL